MTKEEIVFGVKPTDPRFIDLEGRVFGRLTVLGFHGRVKTHRHWWCSCECGIVISVNGGHLKSGHTSSCGCWNKDNPPRRTHGLSKSPEYAVWAGMLDRCNNTQDPAFSNYGGRGIRVCSRWRTFENFIADMGRRPSSRLTLERINNDDGYNPDNCKWATRSEQSNNRRSSRIIMLNGKSQSLKSWCDELELKYSTVRDRLGAGWSVERAFEIIKNSPYIAV